MNILVPIAVSKKLPEIQEGELFTPCVIVRYVNKKVSEDYSALSFAYCDESGRWEDAQPEQREKFNTGGNEVVEWYKEVELESLFPDDAQAECASKNASDNRINMMMMHQEGQNFFKNHLLKKINGNSIKV